MTFNVLEQGVSRDSSQVQTAQIQRLLDSCAANGGGTVQFPAGVYITGSLRIGSNTTIDLETGAVLKGSNALADYPSIGFEGAERDSALLFAQHARNITIRGGGTVDGTGDVFFDFERGRTPPGYDPALTRQGQSYAERPDATETGPVDFLAKNGEEARPGNLMLFIDCEEIRVEGISIIGAPNWCLHLAGCRYAVLTDLFVRNSMLIPNADCIDIANSSYITISDCVLEAGDDGIAITPCADQYHISAAEHINVTNCSISSRSAAIRVGYGIERIRDVNFTNIHIYESNRGIGLFVRNGQIVENITFTNITIETKLFSGWWGAGEPIHVSAVRGYRDDGSLGYIRNVRFQNIYATGESGILLFSDDHEDGECHIKNIEFENVDLHITGSPLNDRYGGNIDLRPASDPSRQIFKYDLAAILSKNVDGLSLTNVTIRRDPDLPEYLSRGLAIEGGRDVRLDRFREV